MQPIVPQYPLSHFSLLDICLFPFLDVDANIVSYHIRWCYCFSSPFSVTQNNSDALFFFFVFFSLG